MHRKLKNILKYKILTEYGEAEKVIDFYFDERKWNIKYIVVNTGGWFLKNLVLVPPIVVNTFIDEEQKIKITLNKQHSVN